MKRFYWEAESNDKCFFDKSSGTFSSKQEAYYDMRDAVLEKMKWNTEWEDYHTYCDEGDDMIIGYDVKFSPNKIVHTSYSGVYTYNLIEYEDEQE